MVWFQCEDCGENLKKPKLAGHFRSCYASRLSCIDCGEFFSQDTVQGHTQCISEAEKYGPKGQNKPSNGAQGKPDKPKPNADVDINVGLSTQPPWFCSLCNTTATSKQALLLHADGKKHRAKAKAFHTSQKQANGAEQTADVKETGAVRTIESAQANGGKSSDHERDEEKEAGKRKGMDDIAIKEPDNTKRQHLTSSNIGDVIQSKDGISENKTKSTADELAGVADCKSVQKQKIKWKKIITKTLKTNPDGVMKLKKLQKLVAKELQECGLTDNEGLHATLMDKIASSSRFSVDRKRVRLVAKNEDGS
ncbi:UBP1-associated proteins 1C-like [Panicum miliaceum]|uniref:UBP1-associated proteins 1C-like n=1 Tax=Panicum miliaceum TaxID=4540 RepID=A0A3L6SMU7_PANMI|nr:UBP1-associated proteins 1C-like [Panicum miliaceum]